MGLDTTHDAWHGSYGSFSAFRNDVAVAAGIIEKGEVLYSTLSCEIPPRVSPIDWLYFDTVTDYEGEWSEEPDDPIWYLLAHSDYDGVIKAKHCEILADRLVPLILTVDDYSSPWMNHTRRLTHFVMGLRLAADRGEDVEFY